VGTYFKGVGVLVKMKLIDLNLVDELMLGWSRYEKGLWNARSIGLKTEKEGMCVRHLHFFSLNINHKTSRLTAQPHVAQETDI
jgi:hypothetical protein